MYRLEDLAFSQLRLNFSNFNLNMNGKKIKKESSLDRRPVDVSRYRVQFYNRCQYPKESPAHFAKDLSELVQFCSFGSNEMDSLIKCFIVGLSNARVQKLLWKRVSEIHSLDVAVVLANLYDSQIDLKRLRKIEILKKVQLNIIEKQAKIAALKNTTPSSPTLSSSSSSSLTTLSSVSSSSSPTISSTSFLGSATSSNEPSTSKQHFEFSDLPAEPVIGKDVQAGPSSVALLVQLEAEQFIADQPNYEVVDLLPVVTTKSGSTKKRFRKNVLRLTLPNEKPQYHQMDVPSTRRARATNFFKSASAKWTPIDQNEDRNESEADQLDVPPGPELVAIFYQIDGEEEHDEDRNECEVEQMDVPIESTDQIDEPVRSEKVVVLLHNNSKKLSTDEPNCLFDEAEPVDQMNVQAILAPVVNLINTETDKLNAFETKRQEVNEAEPTDVSAIPSPDPISIHMDGKEFKLGDLDVNRNEVRLEPIDNLVQAEELSAVDEPNEAEATNQMDVPASQKKIVILIEIDAMELNAGMPKPHVDEADATNDNSARSRKVTVLIRMDAEKLNSAEPICLFDDQMDAKTSPSPVADLIRFKTDKLNLKEEDVQRIEVELFEHMSVSPKPENVLIDSGESKAEVAESLPKPPSTLRATKKLIRARRNVVLMNLPADASRPMEQHMDVPAAPPPVARLVETANLDKSATSEEDVESLLCI